MPFWKSLKVSFWIYLGTCVSWRLDKIENEEDVMVLF